MQVRYPDAMIPIHCRSAFAQEMWPNNSDTPIYALRDKMNDLQSNQWCTFLMDLSSPSSFSVRFISFCRLFIHQPILFSCCDVSSAHSPIRKKLTNFHSFIMFIIKNFVGHSNERTASAPI